MELIEISSLLKFNFNLIKNTSMHVNIYMYLNQILKLIESTVFCKMFSENPLKTGRKQRKDEKQTTIKDSVSTIRFKKYSQ